MTDKTPRAWDGALEQEFYTPEEIAASDARVGKIQREKVINGLENCTDVCCATGETCPYYLNDDDEFDDECEKRLHKDALALLKAQEPRVMMLDECATADLVWYDWRTQGVRPAKINRVPEKTGTYRVQVFGNIDQWVHADEYGEYWRCWTSRPTDEHREATPWD